MDIYCIYLASSAQKWIDSIGDRPGGHGFPRLEDLILSGIAEVRYDQRDSFVPADVQKLQNIDYVPVCNRGLYYGHFTFGLGHYLGIRFSIWKSPIFA